MTNSIKNKVIILLTNNLKTIYNPKGTYYFELNKYVT